MRNATTFALFGLVVLVSGSCIVSTDEPPLTNCGNGILDPGEQCDDGNVADHDGCNSRCGLENFCGDGFVEVGEECDDGNFEPFDGCDPNCQVEVGCGNGIREVGEECDDDNLLDGDGCSAQCTDEVPGAVCGNGSLEGAEGCDDGNTEGGDGCSANCQREDGCGDGFLVPPELCDDGNTISGDGCNADCRLEFICGNGRCESQFYETCDLCPQDCCPDCGNGRLDIDEECDDGNNTNFDGCGRGCKDEDGVADCGNGIWELGEGCDDGNLTAFDGCSEDCVQEYTCGDGVCERLVGETCQNCRPDCCPSCGDSELNPGDGEFCDGSNVDGLTCGDFCYDGGTLRCDSTCAFDLSACTGGPICGDGVAECAEQCDGNDVAGDSCITRGFSGGTLGCDSGCRFDTSGCTGPLWHYQQDFEACNNSIGWLFRGQWGLGAPSAPLEPAAPHGGHCLLGLAIGGNYDVNLAWNDSYVATPWIDLTSAPAPLLVFWSWISTEGNTADGANIKVSTDGLNFTLVDTVSPAYNLPDVNGQPAWGGQTFARWQRFIVDLSAYSGYRVIVRFAFRSNGTVNWPGWYIDDVLVTEPEGLPPL